MGKPFYSDRIFTTGHIFYKIVSYCVFNLCKTFIHLRYWLYAHYFIVGFIESHAWGKVWNTYISWANRSVLAWIVGINLSGLTYKTLFPRTEFRILSLYSQTTVCITSIPHYHTITGKITHYLTVLKSIQLWFQSALEVPSPTIMNITEKLSQHFGMYNSKQTLVNYSNSIRDNEPD